MEKFLGLPGTIKNTFRGGSGLLGFPRPASTPFGKIIEDSFPTSISSKYIAVGGGSWTIAGGGGLTLSGGTPYGVRLTYDYSQCFEEWEIKVTGLRLNVSVASTTYGAGFGVYDQNSTDHSYIGFLDMSTGSVSGTAGKVRLITVPSPVLGTAPTAVTVTTGAKFDIVVSRRTVRDKTVYTVKATKQSDGTISEISWTADLVVGAPGFANASGRFAIWSLGGQCILDKWEVNVFDNKGIDLLYYGDSITHGLYAGLLSNRYPNLVGGSYAISAGSGDTIQMVINKLPNIRDYNPYKVICAIGTNDVAFDTLANSQTAYTSMYNQIVAAGYDPILCDLLPRNGVSNIAVFNRWKRLMFKNAQHVDWYTPLNDGGNLRAQYNIDGTHVSNAAFELMAFALKNQIGLRNAK